MNDFEWIPPLLSDEEEKVLCDYKDNTYLDINSCLRNETCSDDIRAVVSLLDGVIKRGRCTKLTTLFRATNPKHLAIKDKILEADLAFLSTSVNYKCLGQFFDVASPAMLIIQCPPHTPMAVFKHDDGGSDEHERLLPRGMQFLVKDIKASQNHFDIEKSEDPFNHSYAQLKPHTKITIYILEPL